MNIFCDTSVLVASALRSHPHHAPAAAVLSSLRDPAHRGYTSAHALAECFSVLSRMPTSPKLKPEDVLQILETNIIPHFTFVALPADDYPGLIRDFVSRGFSGGALYDFLHLRIAAKLSLDRIHTFNHTEWTRLAPELAPLISPPDSSNH